MGDNLPILPGQKTTISQIIMEINYIYRDNFIYNTNSLVKLFVILNFLILSFLFNNPIYLGVLFLNLIIISLFALSASKCFNFIRYTAIIGFFILIFNILLNRQGNTVLIYFPLFFGIFSFTFVVTLETLLYSGISILQLALMMYTFGLMNIIINPDELMQAFIKLKMPYIFSLLTTLSVRFFPLLMDDLNTISDVQRTRGYEIDKGGWFSRVKNRMVLLLPLLANSLERSIQVSEALEARAFGISKHRQFYRGISLKKSGYLIITLNIGLLGFLIFYGLRGYGTYDIYPAVSPIVLTNIDFIILSVIFFGNLLLLFLIKLGGNVNDRN
ncbi:MAG: energy-coupling factor transporter transmembrane component T family protein [Promethearchaeota archaeon]